MKRIFERSKYYNFQLSKCSSLKSLFGCCENRELNKAPNYCVCSTGKPEAAAFFFVAHTPNR